MITRDSFLPIVPDLTNKDVNRTSNALLVAIPNETGELNYLKTKDMSKQGGERLLKLANKEIQSINNAIKKYNYWLKLVYVCGPDKFEQINGLTGWASIHPSKIDDSNAFFRICSSIYKHYNSGPEVCTKPIMLSDMLELPRKQKEALLSFLLCF